MNLAQLQAAVMVETNRPDLVDETLQAVLEATLSLHTIDNFYKDIVEAPVTFDNPLLYIQTLNTSALPFYRTIAYLRKTNPVATASEQLGGPLPSNYLFPPNQFVFLKRIDIGDALDSYGYEKRDVWYQAGGTVNIKSSTPLQYMTAAWYTYPNLDPTGVNYNSWIANEMPWAIIYKAAGGIFSKIGEDKSWAIYMKSPNPQFGPETGGLYYQQLAQLIRNNIRASED